VCIAHRITVFFLDFFHRPVFLGAETRRFGNWICFRPQVKGGEDTYSVGPVTAISSSKVAQLSRCLLPLHLRTETDIVSETSCFYSQKHRTMGKFQKLSKSVSKKLLRNNYQLPTRAPGSLRRSAVAMAQSRGNEET
jgi:hypothetical protein